MVGGIVELALVMLLATLLGGLAYLSRQPVFLAYLTTGFVVGSLGLFHLGEREVFEVFSNLGIMFLLFLIGLEINYSALRHVGRPAIIIGLGQIIFTSFFGFVIAWLFGFALVPALYIAVALTFSSTVIIVKLLSEKKDLNSLYGRISLGFLLVQDFVAVLVLVTLSGLGAETNLSSELGLEIVLTILKAFLLFFLTIWLGRKIIPFIFEELSRSSELLFLASLSWVMSVSMLVHYLGFSIEIGGFLAGLALANSAEHLEIASRIRPLRDFFILIFFVILGSSLALSQAGALLIPIIIFSFFILVGNPLIVLIIMGFMGYRKRTSFLAGVTVAQISEFSLVLVAMGLKLGHLEELHVTLVTAVGVVTITASSYLILHGEKLYRLLSPYLNLFERRNPLEEKLDGLPEKKQIILIGAHRTGQVIANYLPKKELLIVDFDPESIKNLKKLGFSYLFGDMNDSEILDRINIKEVKVIISTNPDFEDNLTLAERIKHLNQGRKKKIKLIIRAKSELERQELYEAGVDYVLWPHFTAGQYLGRALKQDKALAFLKDWKERDEEVLLKERALLRGGVTL